MQESPRELLQFALNLMISPGRRDKGLVMEMHCILCGKTTCQWWVCFERFFIWPWINSI